MLRKIIVIGTLHAGITPNNELKDVIESFEPDQLLVEIVNDDIVKNDLSSYPPEMIFAFEWAKSNKVKVAGFDSKIDVFREGVKQMGTYKNLATNNIIKPQPVTPIAQTAQ